MSAIINVGNFDLLLDTPELIADVLKSFKENGLQITQEKTLAQSTLYDTQTAVVGASQVEFFTGQPTPARSNMISFQKNESEHSFIYGVRLLGFQPLLGFTEPRNLLDAAVSAATISISINGVTTLKRFPVSSFSTSSISGDDYAAFSLHVPIIWGGQQEMKLTLNTEVAGGFAVAQRFKAELIGFSLI